MTCFREQLLNDLFGVRVIAFAEMVIANLSLCIDEIMRRPVLIIQRASDGVVVVDGDRIVDA